MDPTPITPPPAPRPSRLAGASRSIAMGILAVGLLVVGGSAIAFAADPTQSPAPAETTRPADDGATAPSTEHSTDTTPTDRPARGDCPDKGDRGSDSGSAGASGGGSDAEHGATTPDDTTTPTTPAPTIDASDV